MSFTGRRLQALSLWSKSGVTPPSGALLAGNPDEMRIALRTHSFKASRCSIVILNLPACLAQPSIYIELVSSDIYPLPFLPMSFLPLASYHSLIFCSGGTSWVTSRSTHFHDRHSTGLRLLSSENTLNTCGFSHTHRCICAHTLIYMYIRKFLQNHR